MFNCSRRIRSLFNEEVFLKLSARSLLALALGIAVFPLVDCTRQNTAVERLGILPANLLISDPAYGWLKTAVPMALQYDLMTAHLLLAGTAEDEAGAARGGATRLLRTSIESRQGGVHLESTLVDVATQKVIRVESSDAGSASVVLPAVNALARKIDPAALEFSTKSMPAWQALASAEGNSNPQQRAQFLNQAISRDVNFGLAWVSLLEMIAPNRQAELKGMIDEAKAHRGAFSPFDRAKFDVVLGRLSNAPAADQISAAQAALKLAPNDLGVITTLGSEQILAGESAAGEQSLRRGAALNPSNVSLRFQLARGLMELRKYKDAETILASIGKAPAVDPELATCLLLEGEKARAAAVMEKFMATVQNEELKPLLRGGWEVMSGDRQKGIDLVLGAAFKDPNVQALSLSQASVWQLLGGDYGGAQKTLGIIAKTPAAASPIPSLIQMLADRNSSAVEWRKKIEAGSFPETVKQPMMAYGFFLRGNYEDASKAWQQVVEASHGGDLHARAMLASSLDHAGKRSEAQRIVILPFTPEFTDLYAAISFTEMRRMLGR